jgi:signal peptidase II
LRTDPFSGHPGPVRIGLLVAAIGWVLDQGTKKLAVETLAAGRVVDLPGPIHLELAFNPNAAFGIPAPWWLFPIVTLVLAWLVAFHLPRSQTLFEPFAYGLLLAGALGNLSDRFLRPHPDGFGRGEVVDFIASTFWPTFNVADVCITVGFFLLVAAAVVQHLRDAKPEPAAEPEAG